MMTFAQVHQVWVAVALTISLVWIIPRPPGLTASMWHSEATNSWSSLTIGCVQPRKAHSFPERAKRARWTRALTPFRAVMIIPLCRQISMRAARSNRNKPQLYGLVERYMWLGAIHVKRS